MKKACIFALPFLLLACKGSNDIDVSAFLAERDSIVNVNSQQREELEALTFVMNAISVSLDSIAQQEHLVYFSKDGDRLPQRNVLNNLYYFEKLLERQRNQINVLKDSLKNTPAEKLNPIITFLQQQLDEKEQTIQTLRKQLSQKNTTITKLKTQTDTLQKSVSNLEKKNEAQIHALSTQDEIINQCYVKIGTRKELQEAGLLTGNIFKRKVNYSNLNKENFIKIDIRKFREITIDSQRPKILTAMPESSYRIEKTNSGTILHITDPGKFWSITTYLIIQTN